jgi:HSP20 family molecular chaperone IbpA
MTMLTKYNDTMLTPYFNLFDFSPFSFADDYSGSRSVASNYRVETDDSNLMLSIDLPGVKAADLSVQTSGREVKVTGKLRGKDFKHSYRISKSYDPETVSAELEAGVLTLTFGKTSLTETKTVEVVVK